MRISLLDDLASCWLFARDYNARPSLPSKQPVAGSNPAGRADLRLYLRGAAWRVGCLIGSRLAKVDRGRTGIRRDSCADGEWCSLAAIAIALGQQIISVPRLPDLTVGRSMRLGEPWCWPSDP